LREQLKPEFIARKIKTFESMDFRRFMPNIRCQFTCWPKDLMFHEDLNFGFKFIDDADTSRGRRKVVVSAGDEVPFPLRMMQAVMLNEDTYKVLVSVPRGMRNAMLESRYKRIRYGKGTQDYPRPYPRAFRGSDVCMGALFNKTYSSPQTSDPRNALG